MEDRIKGIVSGFIKLPVGQIGAETPIDRSAVQSSILLHRMYARLAEEGIVVENYGAIKVVGDLLRLRNEVPSVAPLAPAPGVENKDSAGIGIDIEEVAALPRATDFRKETFYTQNFTAAEISYCILQADPYSSLTGLFAVKEAIVKADGQYRDRPFNTIGISHSPEGRPVYGGFGLSISHAGGMAVAVAVAVRSAAGSLQQPVSPVTVQAPAAGKRGTAWITWMALLLAAAALFIALKH